MATTTFQRGILRLLAPSRKERESYVAGGVALNTLLRAPRRSQDIDLFHDTLQKFERGEISADAWRAFRLVQGTYGQRQEGDLSMLRVKIPQGVLDAAQLRAIAEVAGRWSRGFCHITTRQNVQLHFVRLADVDPAMRVLADAGLTTREACGNAVRNTLIPSSAIKAIRGLVSGAYKPSAACAIAFNPLVIVMRRGRPSVSSAS